MNKIFTFLVVVFQIVFSQAAQISTSEDFAKTEFCKKLQCSASSPYKEKNGEMAILYRLKDSLSFDLLSTVDDGKLKTLTFKFINEEGEVDKQLVALLLTSALGRSPSEAELEKVVAGAKTKTTRDQFASAEKVKFDRLSVVSGKVLKKPTIEIEFQ